MPTFMCSMTWTDSGVLDLKAQTAARRKAAKKHAGLLKITIKDIYITSGETDLLYILDAPDGEAVAKFALVVSATGNVRTKTTRAYTAAEFDKILADLSKLKL